MMKVVSAVFATSTEVERRQLRFDESTGLITEFGNLGIPEKKVDWFYSDDCMAFAGMGDIHVHAREDVSGQHKYKEDFHSASEAALNGGVTFFVDMPNNPIPPIDDESYRAKLHLTERSRASVLLYAGIGPHTRPLSWDVPYKVYMGPSVGELFFQNDSELEDVLAFYRRQSVSFHCEDPVELKKTSHESEHHLRRPVKCEIMATQTALSLIEKFQLNGKLCHYSAGEGLPLIRQAKNRGLPIQCEVTPQHLYFSQERLTDSNRNFFQMNPPIRGEEDREALLEAARNGDIDFLATDHAPHSFEEKQKGTSGLTGLDSYGPFVTWLINEQRFSPQRVAMMASENPGSFVNRFLPSMATIHPRYRALGRGFGFLKEGFVANITVLNLKSKTLFTLEDVCSKVGHNPFVGEIFSGKIEQVFIQGRTLK